MASLCVPDDRPTVFTPFRHRTLALLAGFVAWALPNGALALEGRDGARIYRQLCVSCHGESGEGSREYPRRLAGDRSVAQLARLIEKTMPEDAPGECVGRDAEEVASYIHEAFYSRAAQARNKPPRVELSRLTVRQYRNTVTDLIGSFRPGGTLGAKRGLRGQYFRSRGFGDDRRVIDRIDPMVRFDFGVEAPEAGKIEPHEFSIRWEGSVLAPETGEYEFLVRTENALRLWVNDNKRPLIDAWVKSGTDTEFRGSIALLGGRAYPLRLEFSKAKQGVDDSKKRKDKPPPVKASIALEWKLPHRPEELIPERCLTPDWSPESFVVETPFPPDDRSVGYERGTTISKAWDQATTDAAIEAAGHVATRLRELAGVDEHTPDRGGRLREFCRKFAERAFRRPLSEEQKAFFVDRQFEGASDPEKATKRVLLLVLKSPRFLYREVGGGNPFDVASRLSFTLWDSAPDAPLLEAAKAGRLANREQVLGQAERMVSDPRARSKLRAFFLQWLKVENVPDLAKDPAQFLGFDPKVASDLRTSLDLFLEDVAWGESPDFRRLLLAEDLYLNGRLAKFYGVDLPPDAPFRKVSLEPRDRAGLLSHPYLLATFAYSATSSPIHRGVFITRSLLGRTLKPPPEAVAPLPPDLHPDMTTRERITLQTRPSSCVTCHGMINPLGFALEHFDAVGRYRSEEKGRSIDATGTYETRSGEAVAFTGARGLATFLAGSDETHAAFVEQLFHNLVKQPIRAFGPSTSSELLRGFAAHDFNIRKLLAEIAATASVPAGSSPGGDRK